MDGPCVSAAVSLLIRWWIHSAKGLILDAMSFVKIISDGEIKTHILFITRIQSQTEKDCQRENKELNIGEKYQESCFSLVPQAQGYFGVSSTNKIEKLWINPVDHV